MFFLKVDRFIEFVMYMPEIRLNSGGLRASSSMIGYVTLKKQSYSCLKGFASISSLSNAVMAWFTWNPFKYVTLRSCWCERPWTTSFMKWISFYPSLS